ncbi:lantibiotic dehydratase [Lactiplantibacillus sp. DA1]|uniref:lantibiotic dehydratase n=1 Tax=Lactiplantibacillus sp. DA1 TaxID=3079857 RepID=UPI00292A63BF|nr:lantibiotic dehydratase [Lactiplantibacillus sp. DA1]MDV0430279.1 lantibiotic dehydratase [Lactiplantibacillus sp. DA1]
MYKVGTYFLVRTPLLSLQDFKNLANKSKSPETVLVESPVINEAVNFASPSLLKSVLLEKSESRSPKKKRQVKVSLNKYLNRLSTRPTPFGFFAAIGTGNFCERETPQKFNVLKQKHVEADLRWVYYIVDFFEKNISQYPAIQIQSNNALTKVMGFYLLDTKTNLGLTKDRNDLVESIKVKRTILLDFVLNYLKFGHSFQDTVEAMQDKFSIVDSKKCVGYLQQLINQEIVISKLRPQLTIGMAGFKQLLQQLNKQVKSPILDTLNMIDRQIDQYAKIPIGQGNKELNELREEMSKVHTNKHYLKIDVGYVNHLEASVSVKSSIKKAVEILDVLSKDTATQETIKKYHGRFIEKFGYEQLVPLQVLIDESLGLGFPTEYDSEPSEPKTIRNKEIDALLLKKMMNAQYSKSPIRILKNDLRSVSASQGQHQLSGELYCTLHKNSAPFLEVDGLSLSPSAGSTAGRFYDLLSNDFTTTTLEMRRSSLKRRFNTTKFVELSEIPAFGSGANVAENNSVVNSKLNLRGSTNIDDVTVDDIYVGANSDQLYFYSCSKKLRVEFVANNMFNYQNGTRLLRLLREISQYNLRMITPPTFSILDQFDYSPAVWYEDIMLRPAEWNLNSKNVSADINTFDKLFKDWKSQIKLPRYVRLKFADYITYVDTNNQEHIEIIREELKKFGRVQFLEDTYELNGNGNSSFIDQTGQSYANELVVPFVNEDIIQQKLEYVPKNIFNAKSDSDELANWLYVSLQVPDKKQQEFITNILPSLKKAVIKNHEWFFIRYEDQGKGSIRVRIKADMDDNLGKLYQSFINWYLSKTGVVGNFEILPYKKELFRYGGEDVFDMVHQIFWMDSELSRHILASQTGLSLTELLALSFIKMFVEINYPYSKEVNLMNNLVDRYAFSHELHSRESVLVHAAMQLLDSTDSTSWISEGNLEILTQENNLINRIISTKYLTSGRSRIIGSLMHMRCNRIFGINNMSEKKTMATIRTILTSLPFKNFIGIDENAK